MRDYKVFVDIRGGNSSSWKLNGVFHREDGPAFENVNGTRSWYINGLLHREDGPAIEYSNGSRRWYLNGLRQWFINGVLIRAVP